MKKIITLMLTLILVVVLAACSASPATVSSTTSNTTTSSTTNTASNTVVATPAASAAEALAEKTTAVSNETDYAWDAASVIPITLDGSQITADNAAVIVDGSTATITRAGTYSLQGTLFEGQIRVNTQEKGLVRLVLNGANLSSASSAPLYIMEAEDVMIVLADGSVNSIRDTSAQVAADASSDTPNAAVFSMADLTFFGGGSLEVTSSSNDGIASKDGLVVSSGTLSINAADDGLRGKDYVLIQNGSIQISAQGDGIKSDNDADAAKGYVAIENGSVTIAAGGDAIYAFTSVLITNGQFNLDTSSASSDWASGSVSAKAIKGLSSVNIDGGTFTINSADDAIHSNVAIVVNGGVFTITSGDDGLHADASIEINGGEINVVQSYEGIESAVVTINAGNIQVNSSDDGLNVAGGVDSSGMNPGGRPGRPGAAGQDSFASYTGSQFLYIHGGTIFVTGGGDGIDINGAVEMTGGTLVVNGPVEQNNGPLDFDAGFKITGGFVVATGSAGMAQAPGASSTQNSLLAFLGSTYPAGTLISVQNSAGETLLTFSPSKQFESLAFSAPELVNGDYTIYTGGSSTGVQMGGLYQGGVYTPGSQVAAFSVSSVVTQVGQGGMGGLGGGRPARP